MVITIKRIELDSFIPLGSVFYAGVNTFGLPKSFKFIDVTKSRMDLLNSVKESLINLDTIIGKNVIDPIWLASDLAENNLCLEKFTLYIVNTLLARNLILDNKIDLILCDNDEQVWVYSNLLKNNGVEIIAIFSKIKIIWKYMGVLKEKIKYTIISLLKKIYVVTKEPVRFRKSNKLFNSDIVVINWFDHNTIKENKLLNDDRYFGNLLDFLSKKKHITVIAKPIENSLKLFQNIHQEIANYSNKLSYFMLHDFLGFFEITKAFFLSFNILKFFDKELRIAGLDFSFLWKVSCFKEILKHRIPIALETFYAIKACLNQMTNKNVKILYPFENQPWEKMINLAYNNVIGRGKVYAYQHFPISENYLTCYPSKAAIENNIFPYVFTSDHLWKKCLERIGYRRCSVLGNFRFTSTMHNALKQEFNFTERYNKKLILCACSIQFDDSVELVLRTYSILTFIEKHHSIKLKAVVNFHPLMPSSQIEYIKTFFLDKEQDFFGWSLAKADELLRDAFLVFYNSNSIGINAAAFGVPSVYMPSNYQINVDRMPGISISDLFLDKLAKKIVDLCKKIDLYEYACKQFNSFFNSYYIAPNFDVIEELFIKGN